MPWMAHSSAWMLLWVGSTAPQERPGFPVADLIILHEYGEPSHYAGAVSAASTLDFTSVAQVEFTPLRKLKQGFEQRDFDRMKKAVRDAVWLALWTLFPHTLKGKTVIVGIAPLDWRIAFLSRALRRARVIYHSSWTDWSGAHFAKKPTVLGRTIRRAWSNFLTQQVHRFALVTPRVAEQLQKVFKIECERIYVVFHSYDHKVFRPASDRRPATPLKVVFAGRLDDSKGVADVVELARRLPSVEFGLAGDGPLKNSIERARLPNVTLFGRVKGRAALSAIFRRHHVVLLPSKRTMAWEELFGMALVEAMACGCIPMTTDHTGPITIVCDAELRELIFPEDDFLDGAMSALKVLESEADRRGILEQKSIEDARRFALSEIEKIWIEVLK